MTKRQNERDGTAEAIPPLPECRSSAGGTWENRAEAPAETGTWTPPEPDLTELLCT